MAVFVIATETAFYSAYAAYNRAVEARAPLTRLEQLRLTIVHEARRALMDIARVQGAIVCACLLLAPGILGFFGKPASLCAPFSLVLCGVSLHVMTLIVCVMLLYYDLRRETLLVYGVFLMLNGSLTWLLLRWGERFLGLGYLLAAVAALSLALAALKRCLANVHYLTFTRQRMTPRTAEGSGLNVVPKARYYIKEGKRMINVDAA
jgi:uncharacterized membrane protein